MVRFGPHTTTASLLAIVAAIPVGSWVILLFVAPNPRLSAVDSALQQLQFTFSAENPDKLWFVWWAALPVILLALATAYLSRLARPTKAAIALFTTVAATALTTLYLSPVLCLFMLPALYFGFICIRSSSHVA